MNGIRFGLLCARRDSSASEELSKLEYDLVRMALDPNRRVSFFVRFGLILWLTERHHLY
jgi:hypothetical protein